MGASNYKIDLGRSRSVGERRLVKETLWVFGVENEAWCLASLRDLCVLLLWWEVVSFFIYFLNK